MYWKRLQADVLSTFLTLGVKLSLAHPVYSDVLKTSAGRRFEHFSYTWTHSRSAPMTNIRPARPWALAPRSGRFFHTKGMLGRAARDEIGFGGFGWGARVWCLSIVCTSMSEQFFQISQKLPFASQNQKVAFFVLNRHIKTCSFRHMRKLYFLVMHIACFIIHRVRPKIPTGKRFEQVATCFIMYMAYPKYLPADVLNRLQHVS